MAGQTRDNALDHVIVVVFENRSLDNVLGRLYGPGDGKAFDGVLGKDLTNPIPDWAEHGADRKAVPYTVATDMDSPNPDTGEEYPHTNTQLYNILAEQNRFKLGEEISAPYRSFWTAATSSSLVVNLPVKNWLEGNTAETIFNRLEQCGKTWKVYVAEPDRFSFTGLIHYPRLKDRFETHFVPFSQFEADAASGGLPDLSFIEPCLVLGHADYHPAAARALGHGIVVPGLDPPSSILGGEAFLARIYNAYQQMQSPTGTNVWNTALLIGWDEPGGTFDHVPPGPVPPPDPSAPAGQLGFRFDRSGYRVPAVLVSPWVAEGQVFNEEHRHTSLIATLREQWALGDPLTARDGGARTFSCAFALDTPRDPGTWPAAEPRPVPEYLQDSLGLGRALSTLGRAAFNGIRAYAEQNNIQIEGLPADPKAEVPPEQALHIIHSFLAIQFPRLHPGVPNSV
jgi:phospholipase C